MWEGLSSRRVSTYRMWDDILGGRPGHNLVLLRREDIWRLRHDCLLYLEAIKVRLVSSICCDLTFVSSARWKHGTYWSKSWPDRGHAGHWSRTYFKHLDERWGRWNECSKEEVKDDYRDHIMRFSNDTEAALHSLNEAITISSPAQLKTVPHIKSETRAQSYRTSEWQWHRTPKTKSNRT